MRCVAVLGLVASVFGQKNERIQFEVASVKPSPDADGLLHARGLAEEIAQEAETPGFLHVAGTTLTLRNRSLCQLVATAYRVRISEVAGPAWISDVRFDIHAKLPSGGTRGSANEMLQRLLADRFSLKIHHETRTVSGFALLTAKDGSRLAPASESPPSDTAEERKRRNDAMMAEMRKRGGAAAIRLLDHATGSDIAVAVAALIHAPVADETGLTGKYEVMLMLPPPTDPSSDSLEYRVTQAVGKLGLKLERRKNAVQFVIVDSASKTPVAN